MPNENDRLPDGDLMLKMDTACRSTRDLVARNPVEPDLWDGYVVAQAWPFVTALYSGVEQALKMLLMATDPQPTVSEVKKYGHNLSRLYCALSPEDAAHIELHFREHRSLFEFLQQHDECATAERFITHINGAGKAKGHEWWRYTLLDPDLKPPFTEPWTMCEVWQAVCCCLWTRRSGRGRPCERLSQRLLLPLRDIANGATASYGDFSSDLDIWMSHIDGDNLAAWVDLLVKSSRGSMDQVHAPEALRGDLDKMAQRAIERLSGRMALPAELLLLLPASQRDQVQAHRQFANPDEQMLLRRVQHTDRKLTWEPRTGEFRWAGVSSTGYSEAELSGPAE